MMGRGDILGTFGAVTERKRSALPSRGPFCSRVHPSSGNWSRRIRCSVSGSFNPCATAILQRRSNTGLNLLESVFEFEPTSVAIVLLLLSRINVKFTRRLLARRCGRGRWSLFCLVDQGVSRINLQIQWNSNGFRKQATQSSSRPIRESVSLLLHR